VTDLLSCKPGYDRVGGDMMDSFPCSTISINIVGILQEWNWVIVLNEVITVDVLKEALRKVFLKQPEMDEDWIKQMAEFIMDFFGYEDIVLDNTLTPRDRDIFYILEGSGLLKTEMEETTIHKGKSWRIHYWILSKDRILSLAAKDNGNKCEEGTDEERDLYEGLSENVWSSHK